MTTERPIDTLRTAIEEYIRATGDAPGSIVTDFIVGYAAVDPYDADTATLFGYATSASRHVAVGMARMLDHDLTCDHGGDDE